MFRRLLIASVCTSLLTVAAPASATQAELPSASDRAIPVKKVVRQYGDGPVTLRKDQRMVLKFDGKRGDRVWLGVAYRLRTGNPYYGTVTGTNLRGPGGRVRIDRTGAYRLPTSGRFRIGYRAEVYGGKAQHVQLFKQVRVTHDGRGATRLPERRGYQYAVRVRAPRTGLNLVSFGTQLFGVASRGKFESGSGGESLVVAPGLPALGDATYALTEELEPHEQFQVLLDPSDSGKVVTREPTDVGRRALDGPALSLPGGGTQAVIAQVDAADLAVSAQRLLHARVVGTEAKHAWRVLVFPAGGGVVKPSAPGVSLNFPMGAPLYQLTDTTGDYRVLALPTTETAPAAQLELDSVADGGTITVDAAPVNVPARPDGRFTLLTIAKDQPQVYSSSYLSVSDVTVAGPWAVYAGSLTSAHCPPQGPLGCADGNGVVVTSGMASNQPQHGGYVLTMPTAGQTSGSFTVRLTTAPPY